MIQQSESFSECCQSELFSTSAETTMTGPGQELIGSSIPANWNIFALQKHAKSPAPVRPCLRTSCLLTCFFCPWRSLTPPCLDSNAVTHVHFADDDTVVSADSGGKTMVCTERKNLVYSKLTQERERCLKGRLLTILSCLPPTHPFQPLPLPP